MGLPAINLVSPDELYNSAAMVLHFDATYSDSIDNLAATTVLIEVDTVSSFNSSDKRTSTFTNVASGTTCRAALILFNGSWFWRVTAINSSGTTISVVRSFSISSILKRSLYQVENVSKYGPDWNHKRSLFLFENVAKYGPAWSKRRAVYHYENITADPPDPYIERLSATRAAKGSLITIYGNGFGAKADIDPYNSNRAIRGYGGLVYIGETLCNVISWSWQQIVFQIPAEAESGAVKVVLTAPNPPGVRDSNVIGLEVYEAESADDIGIELFVCDKNDPNTILCQIQGAKNKSFQVLLNNPGSGRFSISRYDEKGGNRDYVTDQNFILCRFDGFDVFKWIIESKKPSYVDDTEQQMIDVTGRGVLSLLDRSVVYPEGMPSPQTLERKFSNVHGGAVLRQLLIEAQQRGCLTGVVLDWSADADSLGNPFNDCTNISFHAGTPLSQVAAKLSEGMGLFDIEMTPGLHLKLYKVKGTDKYDTVKYRPGQAIVKHQNQSDSTKITNALLVEGEGGSLIETAHPTSQIDWGRREGYLQARNIQNDWSKLQDYGQMFLKTAAQLSWGIQGTVVKFTDSEGNRLKPFESFMYGDWIGWHIPPEGADTAGFNGKVRVKGITCEEVDETGSVSYVLELNNIMLEHDIRMAQLIERLSMFSQNSALAAPATESPSGISHNHSHSMLLGLDGDDHLQYYNEARHAADSHSAIARVASIKKAGENEMTGVITLAAGSNVAILQNDSLKTLTISSDATVGNNQWFNLWTGTPSKSTTTQVAKGLYLTPEADVIVKGISAVLDDTGRDMRFAIYELSSLGAQIGGAIAESPNITMTGKKNYLYKLPATVTLRAGHYYALVAVLQSGTTLGACVSTYVKDTVLTGVNGYARLAVTPAAGAVWDVSVGTSPHAFGILIEV
ncbi:MAG: IPT/TIG domain-containing protein [Acidobacteriota bacterium]